MAQERSLSRFSEELMQAIPYLARISQAILKNQTDLIMKGVVTIPQYLTLDALHTEGTLKMKDIARILRISLPATTGLINRMVRMKLVKRHHDTRDRRIVYIALTPQGKTMLYSVKNARKKMIEIMFGTLTERERITYLNIIRKIKRAMYEKSRKI